MLAIIRIGIISGKEIRVYFHGTYLNDTVLYSGVHNFTVNDLKREIVFKPAFLGNGCFEIKDVTIGKEFHWQRHENQRFRGQLILRNDGDTITAINVIDIEEYLKSVISSEMNPNASLEFLKAHAIISRTWVMNRILNRHRKGNRGEGKEEKDGTCKDGNRENGEERIRWYDDSQHIGFDVCADDHCQRYQGITRITNQKAIEAVESTAGQVLTFDGEIIDARFSKCCGGAFETFENCWQPIHKPCLEPGRDIAGKETNPLKSANQANVPDLTDEAFAREWIEGRPNAFCNTSDTEVLSQVLNDYDLSTKDFYRWKLSYTRHQISDIINSRSGFDFGEVDKIIPLQRGVSGRITRLKIVGSKRTMIIGKELEIRKTLSPTHLYSSALSIHEENDRFVILGAGWGHGVGLCQIGAAMMAHLGYSHQEILSHYYPGSVISSKA